MTRKICVITGTRAEYGLLRWVMQGIKDEAELTLQIIATGMHLSPEFGLTYREIEADGFLYNMVRNIVGTLWTIGSGRYGPRRMKTFLESKQRDTSDFTAPPQGLCLLKVNYPNQVYL